MKMLPILSLILLAGCVSTQKFKDQESQAQSEKKRADGLAAELETARTALEASNKEGQEFKGRLGAQETELASLKKSVKDLGDSLESNRGELSKKVSELVKEKDALMRKLTEAEAAKMSLEAAKKSLEEAKAAELARVKENYESLTAGLKSEIASGEIKITELKGKLTVNMVDRILFDSGKDEIKPDGRNVLEKLGHVLEGVSGKDIRVEGHSDNKPIVGDLKNRFASNWELSTARATAVTRFLQDHGKIDPKRLVAAGYAEHRPVSPNNTPEERALNRRIEIILSPRE